MPADQGLVHKLMLAVAATFMVSAECASLHSEELQFSPNVPATVSNQFNQAEKSTAIGDLGESAATNHMKSAPSMSGSTNRRDQLRLGDSYLGIQTEKSVPVIEHFKRGDCTTDDECADYSGLPKSEPATWSLKKLRKPLSRVVRH